MDSSEIVFIKIYLLGEDNNEIEVRKLGIPQALVTIFDEVYQRVKSAFSSTSDQKYILYWKDEENDNIAISSDMELTIALTEMKTDVKKLYAKIKKINDIQNFNNNRSLHPMVFCDECNNNIKGVRYKCIMCQDYDLCGSCEKQDIHTEHPMLRIPNSLMFEQSTFYKLIKLVSLFLSHNKIFNEKYQCPYSKKWHCSDYMSAAFQKKKSDKDDKSFNVHNDHEEICCKKLRGRRKTKSVDVCKNLLENYMQYFNPFYFGMNADDKQSGQLNHKENSDANNEEKKQKNSQQNPCISSTPGHIQYLNNIVKNISSLLDPLGIDVDIEIRPAAEEKKKKNIGSEEKNEPSTTQLDRNKVSNDTPQKKEKSADHDVALSKENIDKDDNKITSALSNEKMTDFYEKDDWVSLEHLQEDVKEIVSSQSTGTHSRKKSGLETKFLPQSENHENKICSSNQNEMLYPDLEQKNNLLEPHVREALDKMLDMGFTNEGDWLSHLLQAKNGNIDQALKIITRDNY